MDHRLYTWYDVVLPAITSLVLDITYRYRDKSRCRCRFKNQFMLIMPQITASFKPIFVRNAQEMLQFSFNNFFMVFTIVAVLSYFFFSFEFKYKGIKFLPRAGRLLLMISFGAFFGNTVMTRFAVFIDRIQFLIQQWLHVGGG